MKFKISLIGLVFTSILYYMIINLDTPMSLIGLPIVLVGLKYFTREKILPDLVIVLMISRAALFFIWWPMMLDLG